MAGRFLGGGTSGVLHEGVDRDAEGDRVLFDDRHFKGRQRTLGGGPHPAS